VVIRFGKNSHCISQRNLHVWRLQFAMGEIRGEFKASSNVVRCFLCDTTSLDLDRYAKQVFTCSSDRLSPLNMSDTINARTNNIKKGSVPLLLHRPKIQQPRANVAGQSGTLIEPQGAYSHTRICNLPQVLCEQIVRTVQPPVKPWQAKTLGDLVECATEGVVMMPGVSNKYGMTGMLIRRASVAV
jgi:hypothetical protein